MTLVQYWSIVGKHWKLIIICFLAVGVGALIGSTLMTPIYQSTAVIQVDVHSGSTSSDYNSLLASDQLVQTEAQLATSDPVLREVASHYSGLTTEQLAKETTATARLNTQLFEIDVQDPSPAQAAALANDIAATLIKQQTQLRQQEGTQSTNFLLIAQPAQPTFSPVRPNVLLNTAAGLAAGLFLGLLLAVLVEQLDTRIRASDGLTQLLDWPVLATIWKLDASKNEELMNPTGSNANVEAYRILRTNIGFSAVDKPLHSILVTSALPKDGKSTTAANLAIFMAKAGKKTLLIDADLRRPVQHQAFGLPADRMGLSNAILACSMPTTTYTATDYKSLIPSRPTLTPRKTMLLGNGNQPSEMFAFKTSLDPFIHAVDAPNLWVMPSGPLPPNPPELLDSEAMGQFFTALESCGAEVVIFDTPPLLGLSDTRMLASKVDGVIVVADISRVSKGQLKQVKAILTQTGIHVLGWVLNKQRPSRNETVYSYYYNGTEERSNDGTKNTIPTPVSPPILNGAHPREHTLEPSPPTNWSQDHTSRNALAHDIAIMSNGDIRGRS